MMRIASLNLRATPNRSAAKLAPLIELLDGGSADVVLLQECRAGWLKLVCDELGFDGVRSNELTPESMAYPLTDAMSRSERRSRLSPRRRSHPRCLTRPRCAR